MKMRRVKYSIQFAAQTATRFYLFNRLLDYSFIFIYLIALSFQFLFFFNIVRVS